MPQVVLGTQKPSWRNELGVLGPRGEGIGWRYVPGEPYADRDPPSDEVESPGWGSEPSGSGQPYCWMFEERTLFLSWLTAGRSFAGRCNVVHGLARALGLLDATPWHRQHQ